MSGMRALKCLLCLPEEMVPLGTVCPSAVWRHRGCGAAPGAAARRGREPRRAGARAGGERGEAVQAHRAEGGKPCVCPMGLGCAIRGLHPHAQQPGCAAAGAAGLCPSEGNAAIRSLSY